MTFKKSCLVFFMVLILKCSTGLSSVLVNDNIAFTKLTNRGCWDAKYKNFSSIQDAIKACTAESNCQGVYDYGCDAEANDIYLCPNLAIYKNSSNSCIYQKSEKGQEGWCLDENGVDQNDGAISLGYGWNESKCLEMCKDRKKFENVSACEYHKDSKGCGYHTNPVSKGSGHQDMAYTCWIFQSVVCPPGFPNLERHTERDHGDVCRNEKKGGFKIGWACPVGCIGQDKAPWCFSASGNVSCRIYGVAKNESKHDENIIPDEHEVTETEGITNKAENTSANQGNCTYHYEGHSGGWGSCNPGQLKPNTCFGCVNCTDDCVGLTDWCNEEGKWVHARRLKHCSEEETPGSPCQGEPTFGPCDMALLGFTFDLALNKCEKFAGGGCGLSQNGFRSREECEEKCEHSTITTTKTSDFTTIITDSTGICFSGSWMC